MKVILLPQCFPFRSDCKRIRFMVFKPEEAVFFGRKEFEHWNSSLINEEDGGKDE